VTAIVKVDDIITVRTTTPSGRKNVNKKALPGMEGKVVTVDRIFATVEFEGGVRHRVGKSLLERKSFVREVSKLISFKHNDICVFLYDDARLIGTVLDMSRTRCVIKTLEKGTVEVMNTSIVHRIPLKDMVRKSVVSKHNTADLYGTTTDPSSTRKELETLYRDEFLCKQMSNDVKRKIGKNISQMIDSTLDKFNGSHRSMMCFAGCQPFQLSDNYSRRRNDIKKYFFRYLVWKVREKPKLLVREVPSLFQFTLKKSGNVNAEAGQFIKFKEYLNSESLIHMSNSPSQLKGNYLGIEIECYINARKTELRNGLVAAGLSRFVDVVDDGSLRPPDDTFAVEVRILVKESKCKEILDKTFNVIHTFGGQVNHACGIHVHIDMRNRSADECYTKLYNAQQHLFSAVPEDRRRHEYCVANSHPELDKQENHMRNNYSGRHRRYAAINTDSVKRHGTLEVRIHEGTTDSSRVCHWIDTLLAIINSNKINVKDDLESFLSQLNDYSDEHKELYRQRIQQFAS